MIAGMVLAGLGSSTVAQTKKETLPSGVTQAMVAKGKQVFEGTGLCAACHGPDGKGAIGPDLTDAVWLHGKGTLSEIAGLVDKGVSSEESKSGTPMPARGGAGLTDDEVKAVAAYVWILSRPRPTGGAGNGIHRRE